MRLHSVLGKALRLKVCALISAGSLYVVVAGCDPEVQNALVEGLGNTAVSTMEALFTRDTTPNQPGVPDSDLPTIWGT